LWGTQQTKNSCVVDALPVPTPALSGSGSLGFPRVRDLRRYSHPKAFDFSIRVRLYFNINHLARALCRIRFKACAHFAKFNDCRCKQMASENIQRAKNKKPCNAGFFIEYWLQQIN